MPFLIQLFLIISFSVIVISSYVMSSITISKIRNEIRNYSFVLAKSLSSALISGSEDIENIISSIPFGIIITDDKDRIRFYANLEVNDKVEELKEKLKKQKQYAEIKYENFNIGRIYYLEPTSIIYLTILPYILAIITLGTFFIIVLALRNAYKYEHEKFYSTFAKGLAHQMGTPISSLVANIELLKKGEDRFSQIQDDINKISSILKRFSKIGSSINLQEVSIEEVILNAYKNLEGKLRRNLQLNISGNCKVMGDIELLEWVFENLIKNSYEANSTKIEFKVSENKYFCIIDVIDNGVGISNSIRRKIFSDSITTKSKGWGIGLLLSNRIIRMHRGKIKLLESVKGMTTFRILLPKVSTHENRNHF
ncbi:MAG: HAMP domain-containing histidine kinase [candidate division WOR-3 bacterium]|nr:HAMP domain-containing histidine kinase [candidate division WOR-3 bacterium]MCX7947614.1 HAMP domain-containing histidine kinase [candidate division WOR-3 bacterium]MDW8150376.1 HAMP domain-containing sensor histidine kinase [candidate division WOR-3 bacterium]